MSLSALAKVYVYIYIYIFKRNILLALFNFNYHFISDLMPSLGAAHTRNFYRFQRGAILSVTDLVIALK
jgi:hypothetical protein